MTFDAALTFDFPGFIIFSVLDYTLKLIGN